MPTRPEHRGPIRAVAGDMPLAPDGVAAYGVIARWPSGAFQQSTAHPYECIVNGLCLKVRAAPLDSAAYLTVDHITAGYGGAPVLRDVSLSVGAGECVGVFGPNGAGKTTLLRSISRLVRPTGGEIVVDGIRIASLAPHRIVRLGIGHVPEGRRIIPSMTGTRQSQAWRLRTRRARTGAPPRLRVRAFPNH